MQTDETTLLGLKHITKHYPGVKALTDVELDIRAGEVHALAGENGAGKSTLLKIMAGVTTPDEGQILWQGKPIRLSGPAHALAMGIRLIHQELSLVPQLSIAENLFLGAEPAKLGFVRKAVMEERARAVLQPLGLEMSAWLKVANLSIGQQQMVEIARALAGNARIIAMDEPTSALTHAETLRLFEVIDRLREQGIGIIYISHRMEELTRLADRVTVLRDGLWVTTRKMSELPIPELIKLMVGRPAGEEFPQRTSQPGATALSVRGLNRKGVLHDVTFDLRIGEILGIAGLMGSGRTELLRALFGADAVDAGEISLNGTRVTLKSPTDAIAQGIVLVPEDRKHQGLVLDLSVGDNITLACLRELSKWGFLRAQAQKQCATRWIQDLGIRTPSAMQRVKNLSGGNQQKVVLSKALSIRPRVLLLDEPTRGIDVGAKAEIYEIMNRLAAGGLALVMVSSELPEVLGMSDRVLVMHEGRLAGIVPRNEASQERLMHLAMGQA